MSNNRDLSPIQSYKSPLTGFLPLRLQHENEIELLNAFNTLFQRVLVFDAGSVCVASFEHGTSVITRSDEGKALNVLLNLYADEIKALIELQASTTSIAA